MTKESSRRDLLRATVGGAVTAALANRALGQQSGSSGVPTRRLGRTGEQVSILCLGGGHIASLASKDKPEAVRIMHAAVDEGVTFFDTPTDGGALGLSGRRAGISFNRFRIVPLLSHSTFSISTSRC